VTELRTTTETKIQQSQYELDRSSPTRGRRWRWEI